MDIMDIKLDFVTKKDAAVEEYAALVGMDDRNKAAMKVLSTKGPEAFLRHVYTGDNGKQLSYAEMRSRYG